MQHSGGTDGTDGQGMDPDTRWDRPAEEPAERRRRLLKGSRKELGLSQAELAAQLGVGRETLSTWETRRPIPDGKWAEIERFLAEPIAYLESAESYVYGISFENWKFLRAQSQANFDALMARDEPSDGRGLPRSVPMPNVDAAEALTPADVQRLTGTLSPAVIGLALQAASAEELAAELLRRTQPGQPARVVRPLYWQSPQAEG